MYDQSLEQLIDIVIEDGVITDQERKVVYKKATSLGIDRDEIEVYLEGRLQKAQKGAAPKSGKHGVIKTCPSCGAPVVAGMAKCPDCGFAYTGIEAVNSAKELDRRLREVEEKGYKGNDERANIIRSFPIPNAREDLVDFLSALEPKALKSYADQSEGTIIKAYREKFMECLNKMKISFPDDPATKMFQDRLVNRNKKRKTIWLVIAAIVVLIAGAIVIGVIISDHNKSVLRNEYLEWKAEQMSEIEAYANERDSLLNLIPTPTVRNWEDCGRMWNAVSWSKKWKTDSKYKEVRIGDPWELDGTAFKAFITKKNNIGKQIRQAHYQALINNGVSKYNADDQTRSEFWEGGYR